MSQAALCKAVRDQLKTALSLDENSCEVRFDGQPPAACGEEFYAVHPLGWNGISGDHDLHEEVQVGVTLTLRTTFAPDDRRGVDVWLANADSIGPDGMETKLRKVIAAIHKSQDVRVAANVYITDGSSGKFFTPLWFIRTDPLQIKMWDWFSENPPQSENEDPVCGVSCTITFGKCQRCQPVEDMD